MLRRDGWSRYPLLCALAKPPLASRITLLSGLFCKDRTAYMGFEKTKITDMVATIGSILQGQNHLYGL